MVSPAEHSNSAETVGTRSALVQKAKERGAWPGTVRPATLNLRVVTLNLRVVILDPIVGIEIT